jgi:hypothetical protein
MVTAKSPCRSDRPAFDGVLSRSKLETVASVGLWVLVGAGGTPSSMPAMRFAAMGRSYGVVN